MGTYVTNVYKTQISEVEGCIREESRTVIGSSALLVCAWRYRHLRYNNVNIRSTVIPKPRTCLHRPHWNASVSACTSPAPSVLNRFSSLILLSAAFRSSLAISALDILQNRDTGSSPDATASRRPGLFLSLRLTKSVRILALYGAVTPPWSA